MKKFSTFSLEEEKEYFQKADSREHAQEFLSNLFYRSKPDQKTIEAFDLWRKNPHEGERSLYFQNLVPNVHGVPQEDHRENVQKALFGILGNSQRFFNQ